MIPDARLQEIEKEWQFSSAWPAPTVLDLVADVRRLREQRDEFFIEIRRLREALERIAGPAQREARSAIARAALTEESDQ